MKRGKPLQRRKPLKRSWMRRKPRRRKTTEAGRRYMLAVKELPCCVATYGPQHAERCSGDVEAHHAGRRPGVGMKCSDLETIPLCSFHHRAWHDGTYPFVGYSKSSRRRWADKQIAISQAMVAGRIDTTTGEAL